MPGSCAARIDLQIRRLLEGSNNVAERLMRDALYLVGKCQTASVAPCARGPGSLPTGRACCPSAVSPETAVARGIRPPSACVKRSPARKRSWNKFCAGSTQVAADFPQQMPRHLAAVVDELGAGRLLPLWFRPSPRSGQLSLLKAPMKPQRSAGHGNGHGYPAGAECAGKHPVPGQQLYAPGQCNGRPDSWLPFAENRCQPGIGTAITRRNVTPGAGESCSISQVAREIQNNLDARRTGTRRFLPGRRQARRSGKVWKRRLRQVIGALTMMRHDGGGCGVEKVRHRHRTAFSAVRLCAAGNLTSKQRCRETVAAWFLRRRPADTARRDFDRLRQKDGSPALAAKCCRRGTRSDGRDRNSNSRKRRRARLAANSQRTARRCRSCASKCAKHLAALQKDSRSGRRQADVGPQIKQRAVGAGRRRRRRRSCSTRRWPRSSRKPPEDTTRPRLKRSSSRRPPAEEVDAEILEIFLAEAEEVLASIDAQLPVAEDEQPQDDGVADRHPPCGAYPQGQWPDGRAQGFR
jgi:hypothetical protein